MIDLMVRYWYVVAGIGGAAVYIALLVQRDKSNLPQSKKVLYALAPALNPLGEERRGLTSRAIWLAAGGLLLVLCANLFVFLIS